MITKKQLEKEIEEFKRSADMSFKVKSIAQGMVFDENRKIAEATLTQTNEIIEMIEELEDEDSGDIILFKKLLLTEIKGGGR